CLQTSRSTCSAASAATLLRAAGIDASEAEMANLCLTRDGTTWAGLYHGLKQKTADTPWDVEIFRGTLDELKQSSGHPALLSVELREKHADSGFAEQGWVAGQAHTVVLFRFVHPTVAVVGDPAIGRELWSAKDLEILWHGEGIRLIRRPREIHTAWNRED